MSFDYSQGNSRETQTVEIGGKGSVLARMFYLVHKSSICYCSLCSSQNPASGYRYSSLLLFPLLIPLTAECISLSRSLALSRSLLPDVP